MKVNVTSHELSHESCTCLMVKQQMVYSCMRVHTGADAAALSHLAEGHLGGKGPAPGPEHPAAPDRGLRHPGLHAGAHHRPRLQLW